MNIVAQVFGFIALIVYCTSIQFKKKKKIVKFQILSNLFYSLQYLMLNAYSGIYVSLIGMSRSIILYKYEESKKIPPIFILYILIGLTVYSGILAYSNLISLIPIIGGICISISIWQKNLKIFRIVCVLNALVWLIYNLFVGAYIGAAGSIIELTFSSVSFIKMNDIKKK